jgi:hypothetical protein
MAKTLYHILPRTPKGGPTTAAKKRLREDKINLSYKASKDPDAVKLADSVFREFAKVLPKNVVLPGQSPFLILATNKIIGPSPLAECKCQCSITSSCGGGGGGGG